MEAKVVVMPGDGIGQEITDAALAVLDRVMEGGRINLRLATAPIGGSAIRSHGTPLPEETVCACEDAEAALLGAVGDPAYDDPDLEVRPEQGLLALRSGMGLFANLRPVRSWPALADHAPLRRKLLDGIDLLFVRELTGGIYFGERSEQGDGLVAHDTMTYRVEEVERVASVAFRVAGARRRRVTSIDKANVLASSRLWRRTVTTVAARFPDIDLEHVLVDAAAMHLLTRPADFDVILAPNLFGDILSDEASVLAGSLGMLPSASLGLGSFGLYEPVHGSAPDLAGRNRANPCGMILSAAMMLRHSLGMEREATAVEDAVEMALKDGARTADIANGGGPAIGTREFTHRVLENL